MADRGARSGVVAGAAFVGGVAAAMVLAEAPYPRPGADVVAVQRYFRTRPVAPRLSVAGQLVSAAALGRFTGSVVRLVDRSGPPSRRRRALRLAATTGGAIAATTVVASALGSAALTAARGDDEATARRVHRVVFVAGGPAHGVGLGLLVGALSAAGIAGGELPRPLAVAGLAAAVAGIASPASLVAEPAAYLIPAGRFTGLVVIGVAGHRLARAPAASG